MTAASNPTAELVVYIDPWDIDETDPMEGGPWVDDTPGHRPVLADNGRGWRCTCARYAGADLRDMRGHADRHKPTDDQAEETNR
ncbi:hypothetical protein ACIGB8_28730 [Promicromonospora sukumoe]|uniref:hypothetical protein n=1 Tax=Promicromonospora sukumoe TaxID=88382 RepID=UPI0037C94B6C